MPAVPPRVIMFRELDVIRKLENSELNGQDQPEWKGDVIVACIVALGISVVLCWACICLCGKNLETGKVKPDVDAIMMKLAEKDAARKARKIKGEDVDVDDGSVLHCSHREEPKVLLGADGQPTMLITQCTLPQALPNTVPTPAFPRGEGQHVTRVVMQPINTERKPMHVTTNSL